MRDKAMNVNDYFTSDDLKQILEKGMIDRAQTIAEQHWQWLAGLLETIEDRAYSMETLRYLYITAFVHGWKHAKEE